MQVNDLMLSDNSLNVKFEYFALLFHPFLALFHYLWDGYVVVFGVDEEVVMEGVGKHIGLHEIQSVLFVVFVLVEFNSALFWFCQT